VEKHSNFTGVTIYWENAASNKIMNCRCLRFANYYVNINIFGLYHDWNSNLLIRSGINEDIHYM